MKPAILLASAAALALAFPAAVSAQTSSPAAAAAPAATAASDPAKTGKYGEWGFALDYRDTAVKPGDDFERHASGKWLANTPIPADRASIGSFLELFDRTQAHLRDLITKGADTKYGAFYASFMDEKTIEARGNKPLLEDVARVRAIATKRDFARFMGTTRGDFGMAPFDWSVEADTADPGMNVLWIYQGGIGMPERDYYLKKDFAPQRAAYRAYIARTLATLGEPNAAAMAGKVMAFETAIAEKSWPAADRRDVDKVNNPMSSVELTAWAPGIEWTALWEGAGVPAQKRMIVSEKTAIRDIAGIYDKTPLDVLKAWQMFHIADGASPYLGRRMVESRFQYRKTISGVKSILPRWKRAVAQVDGSMGELLGQDYVKAHFPPAAKAEMETLVANLKLAMADRIKANAWMGAPTKAAALEKLARMDVMVGYPDKFRDYSGLTIDAGDLYGNVKRAGLFDAAYTLADLGKPVDRKKWAMNPQTINAYNGGLENKIVFPAAILQAPFFDMGVDDAVNYGAIGGVIGHEIVHGFDDQGRKIDATGAVRDWWTKEDNDKFVKEAKVFGDQYAKFEAAPGLFVNPDLTMGENIADLGGLTVALDAYRKSLGGKEAPVIDGLTGEQRFFLAWAQVWREKSREDALRSQVTADPHSPGRFRVLGPLANIDDWYKAFGVKPGDKMYIPAEKRARLW
ncbi:M13 family metallopeptidase [Novosphingobium sp. TH158]|uniref:M13 family metallopeptidase n=1 Tax=Novosphingobium sp. TH158 TaxID=2067455 RepID=UPI00156FBFAE|nr:M13 family metallopeptidase [Novosphingobium sp. TH158]